MSIFDKKEKKVETPVVFNDDWRDNPLLFMDKDVNGETSFAILKTTENGKWMRGGRLFYSLNGVDVYTDPDNIIFVNLETKSLFIREYSKVIKDIAPKEPEEKQYILLYTDLGFNEDTEEFPLRWEACQGRTKAYDHIIANAPVIDIDRSLVLVESVSVKDALTVREFVNYIKNADYVEDDGFDINSYTGSEYV